MASTDKENVNTNQTENHRGKQTNQSPCKKANEKVKRRNVKHTSTELLSADDVMDKICKAQQRILQEGYFDNKESLTNKFRYQVESHQVVISNAYDRNYHIIFDCMCKSTKTKLKCAQGQSRKHSCVACVGNLQCIHGNPMYRCSICKFVAKNELCSHKLIREHCYICDTTKEPFSRVFHSPGKKPEGYDENQLFQNIPWRNDIFQSFERQNSICFVWHPKLQVRVWTKKETSILVHPYGYQRSLVPMSDEEEAICPLTQKPVSSCKMCTRSKMFVLDEWMQCMCVLLKS